MSRTENPGWKRRPDADEAERLWQVRRAPERGELTCVILSHDLTGRETHYWRGRTQPCQGEQCEACNSGQRSRWHGWLACIDCYTKQRILVEITAHGSKALDEYFRDHRTLRGAELTLKRTSQRANARTSLRVRPSPIPVEILSPAPALEPMLLRMWEIKLGSRLAFDSQREIKIADTGTHGRTPDGADVD